jgi:hypothetical protein
MMYRQKLHQTALSREKLLQIGLRNVPEEMAEQNLLLQSRRQAEVTHLHIKSARQGETVRQRERAWR